MKAMKTMKASEVKKCQNRMCLRNAKSSRANFCLSWFKEKAAVKARILRMVNVLDLENVAAVQVRQENVHETVHETVHDKLAAIRQHKVLHLENVLDR